MNRFESIGSRILTLGYIILTTSVFITTVSSQNLQQPHSGNRIPDSIALQYINEYLAVLNSGKRANIRTYIADNYDSSLLKRRPIDMQITMQMALYYQSGGLGYEFHSICNAGSNEICAVLYNKLTESWNELLIPLSEESPRKINKAIEIKPTARQLSTEKARKLDEQEIIDRLDICLKKLAEDDEFSGSVLVAKNGKPLLRRAIGFASKSYQVPNKVDTKFNIASLGKMFTGVAVVQLVEQGKLAFEDPVSKYLSSDWINPEIGDKIQIRHLLTHTSGFGTYFRKLYMQTKQPFFRNIDDYKILIADEIPAFEPGAKWSYSNTGMHLLGVVIEKVTGTSYFDYMRENIYEPAGMLNTDAYDKDVPLANRATGYTKEGGLWRTIMFTRVLKGGPSGGGYSTVEDLMNFEIALRKHTLLSKEFTGIALSSKPEIGSPFYGYGFFVEQSETGRIVSHGGDGGGISSQFNMYLDSGYMFAVLSNYSPPAANIVTAVLNQMIASQ